MIESAECVKQTQAFVTKMERSMDVERLVDALHWQNVLTWLNGEGNADALRELIVHRAAEKSAKWIAEHLDAVEV